MNLMNCRRRISVPKLRTRHRTRSNWHTRRDGYAFRRRWANVRCGSKADIEALPPDVRFTLNSRHRPGLRPA
jgi:hypothetical protein